ncbi:MULTISPECIES: GNAT family N-acetyltransferase [unclassified Dermacoccus]|uniref:GNAT family N-acetyltransferase n=1 Tax=unclassified Dermacoccus TaxID=2643059 RepID=UPI00101D9BF3|nr:MULTISPECIES: GNAT family N-acetyltransferase [unclassified Dermacoccus]MBZ4497460.1 GNAT family N-acetyltransferase [Dermacoccus sp. Tok2021]RYI21909.1 GNAT family N-acetyltransferase [Dermacoccus sp. 147Ba]
MLRTSGVRTLSAADVDDARALCDLDRVHNVFVAARLDEGLLGAGGVAFGLGGSPLRSMVWASANVVPVNLASEDVARYASRLRRGKRRFASLFGPADQTLALWNHLRGSFGEPMSYRPEQPLMLASRSAREKTGVTPDRRVRPARRDDLDALVPAAAAMFTEEIGYRPYVGSDAVYRAGIARLVEQERTYVVTEGEEIVFKADVGSLASGVAQIQGVWVAPSHRGRGLAAPCMAAVADLVEQAHADTVSLYVNDYNLPALRAYLTAGFERVGTFATVIL